ncbi:MAG: CooT family nickel-binding protein [Deltaproteobacteria bacterium]|nr:CooT family nickel-binding protein [Deltaproteobacteria bacterium]
MCEASAYLVRDGKEELILENVEELFRDGNTIRIVNLFGDQRHLEASIKNISFVENKIVLEKTPK